MTEPDGIRSSSPSQEVTGPWSSEGPGKGLATRQAGDVLLGGASGANENGQVGRWDVGEGKARAAFPVRLGRG